MIPDNLSQPGMPGGDPSPRVALAFWPVPRCGGGRSMNASLEVVSG